MALMLDAGDIMEQFPCPDEAKLHVLDCMSRLAEHVEPGEEARLRLAFDMLAGIRMRVYD